MTLLWTGKIYYFKIKKQKQYAYVDCHIDNIATW